MKKALLSPLCSGLVIPGLGQVINGHTKKGICILALVFIIFAVILIKAVMIVSALFRAGVPLASNPKLIMQKMQASDISLLWLLLAASVLLWLYSVLDAYLTGKKLDQSGQGDHL